MSANTSISDIEPMTRLEGRSRRKMSIAIGLVLAFLVLSFYAVTLVRLKENVAKRAQLDTAASASSGQVTAPAGVNTKQGK